MGADKIYSVLLQNIQVLLKIMSMFNFLCLSMLSCFIKMQLAQRFNNVNFFISARSATVLPAAARTPVDCRPGPYHIFSTSAACSLFQPLLGNSVINCRALCPSVLQNFMKTLFIPEWSHYKQSDV